MYTLPDLPYAYDALAPVISEDIMRLHHQKHHLAYVEKLNALIEEHQELARRSLIECLTRLDELPADLATQLSHQGGGHYNHSLFWQVMTPGGSSVPEGSFADAVHEKWGSLEALMTAFSEQAQNLFGSGWVWLTSELEIIALPNQDTTMALGKGEPLMGLDVWEHAYYLDYHSKRDEYIRNWWRVVNWSYIADRYETRKI